MRWLLAAISIPLVLAQQDPPADELLTTIRRNMRENIERLPDYTCRLTIDRSVRQERAKHFTHIDTVRIEVGYVDGKELFAWPGQKFESRRLEEMMPPGGAVGNGDFALHVRALFMTDAPRFTYIGRAEENGQPVVLFRYVIPREKSRYALGNGTVLALVGYHGSFAADAKTLRLTRLDIEIDEIPPQLKIIHSESKLSYMVARIGGADFLLPKSSEMSMVDASGRENRNLTGFEQCRQYQGESVLSFADPGATTEAAKTVTEVQLPGGLMVEMILRTELQLDHAVVGDPIQAVVAHDVMKSGSVVIPKGAAVIGRITRVGRTTNGRVFYKSAGLRMDSVEFADKRAEFIGNFEVFAYAAAQITVASGEQLSAAAGGRRDRNMLEAGESIVSVRGNVSHIPAGAHMYWRTLSHLK